MDKFNNIFRENTNYHLNDSIINEFDMWDKLFSYMGMVIEDGAYLFDPFILS